MSRSIRVALVGDFCAEVTAHQAIPKALAIAGTQCGVTVQEKWINTRDLASDAAATIKDYNAVWCVPASPYESMQGALDAIRHARVSNTPFLGTCGGYQHAVLEYARNVLSHEEAGNAEVDTETTTPLIGPLSCALVERSDVIELVTGSNVQKIYARDQTTEGYHCSYGVAPEYLHWFDDCDLKISGYDRNNEPRCFELRGHRFFVGTAFQPERSALLGEPHPLVSAFVRAGVGELNLS